jgi:hypothetical protein
MEVPMMMRASIVFALAVVGCSNNNGGGGTSNDLATTAPPPDLAMIAAQPDLSTTTPPPDAATTPTEDMATAATTQTLTVKNYLAWCSVTVNGGAASSASVQTVQVAPGTIALSAVADPGFELGATPWHDTAGDTGSGDPGTRTGSGQTQSSATTVSVGNAAKCVWVCCETVGVNDCPTTDQCP